MLIQNIWDKNNSQHVKNLTEDHRKATIQVQYSLFGVFSDVIIGTAPMSAKLMVTIAEILDYPRS